MLIGPIPDETTILNFRHRLEDYGIGGEVFTRVTAFFTRKGLLLNRGSIVDATIISSPSSTKNADSERDPEIHQTKKGNQWFSGMKAHIGVDAASADIEVADELLHGKDQTVHAHSGYTGADKRAQRRDLGWEISPARADQDDAG